MSRTLILGGARSGKSRYALGFGESLSEDRVFIATAQGFDEGMRERISRHRSDRDVSWRTVEELVEVWDVIGSEDRVGRVVVLDCLTLWLNNLIGDLAVPVMETDIWVTHRESKQALIFDTKFYKAPFKGRSRRPTVNSGHLYQLYAYLSKSDDKDRPVRPTGILLYGEPSSGPGQLRTRIDGFPVFVKTLNLNQNWKNVEANLLCVFDEVVAGV